ncbi:MAG: CRISPR-associated endonuclease Cas2 [Candidatus Kuenenia sp.]|nr:CRISPR-associated endonuclease Cas2 [Candidatus Kuenenia hertensis]
MWIIVMFDLPTDTKKARKAYHEFRKRLLNDGFSMLQFSVYARHTPSEENAVVHETRVKAFLPDDGEVRLLKITDKQFERMKVFNGKTRKATEKAPKQLTLF